MKFLKLTLIVAVIASMMITSCNSGETSTEKYSFSFDIPEDVSYNIGILFFGSNLKRMNIQSLNYNELEKGMKEGLKMEDDKSGKPSVHETSVQNYMVALNQENQTKLLADSNYVAPQVDLPDSMSYNFGILFGKDLAGANYEKINVAAVVKGIKNQLTNTEVPNMDESQKIYQAFAQETDSLRKIVNEQYLTDNKTKDGVVTTQSGLQYEVVTKGDGDMPSATDKVKVHYKGTLVNGKTFDSSYDRGEPIEFPLNGVIPGWTEGLGLMPVGSKYTLTIPYDLGYGERGNQSIPPFSTLVFEVELLDITTAPAADVELPAELPVEEKK
jgi:FKBP-type peptidyl-prolyl cis-trans isomerase